MCQWILTTIITLKRGNFEDAVAEELDLVFAIREGKCSRHPRRNGLSAVGVVASSQSGRLFDGKCKGKMAEDSHEKDME
jgi:hypothetical protein